MQNRARTSPEAKVRSKTVALLTVVMDRAANLMSAGELDRSRRSGRSQDMEKQKLKQQLLESRTREREALEENRKLREELRQYKRQEAYATIDRALASIRAKKAKARNSGEPPTEEKRLEQRPRAGTPNPAETARKSSRTKGRGAKEC